MTSDVGELNDYARQYYLNPDHDANKRIERFGQAKAAELIDELSESWMRVCEMGYGDGTMAALLASRFDDLTVVEGSSLLAAEARKRGYEVAESLFESYVPRERFDLVLCLHVLDHVADPKALLTFVRQRWLKTSGRVVATVPNAYSYHRRLAVQMGLAYSVTDLGESDELVGHYRVYTLATLKEVFSEAGFRAVSTDGYQFKAVPNMLMASWPDDVVKACFDLNIWPATTANLLIEAAPK